MNKKLLTGAAIAAAGVAATYLIRRKRNKSSATSQTTDSSNATQGRSSKHMTDVFSNAKTASQSQAWSPARDESL